MPKTIKELPEHTRPREKLRERGPASLTDEELVCAILGMGTAGVDVRTMSRNVMNQIRERRETQSRLIEAGKILGIRVLDHVIVSRKGYFVSMNLVRHLSLLSRPWA